MHKLDFTGTQKLTTKYVVNMHKLHWNQNYLD